MVNTVCTESVFSAPFDPVLAMLDWFIKTQQKTYISSISLSSVCATHTPVSSALFFTADQVRRQLMRLHTGKGADPDGASPRVLKACYPAPRWRRQGLQTPPVLWLDVPAG